MTPTTKLCSIVLRVQMNLVANFSIKLFSWIWDCTLYIVKLCACLAIHILSIYVLDLLTCRPKCKKTPLFAWSYDFLLCLAMCNNANIPYHPASEVRPNLGYRWKSNYQLCSLDLRGHWFTTSPFSVDIRIKLLKQFNLDDLLINVNLILVLKLWFVEQGRSCSLNCNLLPE